MKRLTAYFSASGVTAKAARELASLTASDLYEIKPEKPYSAADLDWTDKNSRSSAEMKDRASRPAIRGPLPDTGRYDMICIGFPIWWGVAPRIISTFIESCDLQGKQIVIFATSGGSQLEYAVNDLRASYPELDISGHHLNKEET